MRTRYAYWAELCKTWTPIGEREKLGARKNCSKDRPCDWDEPINCWLSGFIRGRKNILQPEAPNHLSANLYPEDFSPSQMFPLMRMKSLDPNKSLLKLPVLHFWVLSQMCKVEFRVNFLLKLSNLRLLLVRSVQAVLLRQTSRKTYESLIRNSIFIFHTYNFVYLFIQPQNLWIFKEFDLYFCTCNFVYLFIGRSL